MEVLLQFSFGFLDRWMYLTLTASAFNIEQKILLIDRMQMQLKKYLIWRKLKLNTVSWPSQVSESGTTNFFL